MSTPSNKLDVAAETIFETVSAGHIAQATSAALSEFSFLYQASDGRLLYAPEQLSAILSVPAETLQQSSLFSLMAEGQGALVMADLREAATRLISPEARNIELVNADGSRMDFRLHYYIRPLGTDASGNADWTVVVKAISTEPIVATELKELRRMRRESESLLQYGTFDYDIQHDKGEWSEGLFAILGYPESRPEVNKALLSKHVKNELRREQMRFPDEVSPRCYSVEYNVTDEQEQKKIVRVTGRIFFDELGMPCRDVGLMMDITNLRSQQATISKYIDELKRSNRGLEEFAYVASHDLQEPLRKISTFSGRLAVRYSNLMDREGNTYLERIIAAADSMRHLMDNLLEFSRISIINQPTTPTNLNFILQQVKLDLELRIDETGTSFTGDKLPVIEAAPSQIKQLFTNLVNNSIKFARPGVKPEISVTATTASPEVLEQHHLSPERKYVQLVIEDNGIGFENEYAERIFQIFQRLHGKSEYPGSGIGLAICRKIAESHNGTIYAENIPNTGARFVIILPESQS